MLTRIIFFLIILSSSLLCQSQLRENYFNLGLSLGYLTSNTHGSLMFASPQISYQISDRYKLKLQYRYGGTIGGFGVEHHSEYDDDIKTYNELVPMFVLNFTDENLSVFAGTGISISWGRNQINQKFNNIALPVDIGLNYCFSENINAGVEFISAFSSKETFRGFGIDVSLKL